MKAIVIGFSGGISSGKSTLSKSLANSLDIVRVSFGDRVRAIAKDMGLSESREQLQALGESLIDKDLDQFCLSVLTQAEWQSGQSLIVDGIRHLQVLEMVSQLVAPLPMLLVYVSTEEAVRVERQLSKEGMEQKQLQYIDTHSTEIQVHNVLQDHADLIVDGSISVEEASQIILNWLESKF
jgi:cytidylate kinase